MDMQVAITMLTHCAQFKKLKKAELQKLLSMAMKREFAADETIYTKGEPSNDKFCMIVSGTVKAVKNDGSVLRLLGNSQVIGEIAVSDEYQTRTITMIATELTEVLEWYVSSIKEQMPKVWKNLQALAGTHLSNFYEE
jgi:CRP-like cAMP-binding protein